MCPRSPKVATTAAARLAHTHVWAASSPSI